MCFNCGLKRLGYAILTEVFYQRLLTTNPNVTREHFIDTMAMTSINIMWQEIQLSSAVSEMINEGILSPVVEERRKSRLN